MKIGIKEFQIEPAYFSIDKRVIDLHLPSGCLVLFIKRSGAFIVPDGATKFESYDEVLIVTKDKEDVAVALKCFKDGAKEGGLFYGNEKSDQTH